MLEFDDVPKSIDSVSFSPDNKNIFAVGNNDGDSVQVKVWAVSTGKEILSIGPGDILSNDAAFSPDGTRIVASSPSGADTLRRGEYEAVYDVSTGKRLLPLVGAATNWLRDVDFSPDGRLIAAAGFHKSINTWDAQTGKLLLTLSGHTASATCVAFSNDSNYLISASLDTTAVVWDAQTGNRLSTLSGHVDQISKAVFSPDDKQILTVSRGYCAKVWAAQPSGNATTGLLHGHGLSLSPDGKRICGKQNGTDAPSIWNTATGAVEVVLSGQIQEITDSSFSPDGTRIVISAPDNTVGIWDSHTGEELFRLAHKPNEFRFAQFSPDGSKVLTHYWGDGRYRTTIWDAFTGKELSETGEIKAFTRDGQKAFVVSDDEAKVIEFKTGKELLAWPTTKDDVLHAAFYPDGSRIVTASWGVPPTAVWDTNNGTKLFTLPGHADVIANKNLSPDGSRICGCVDDYVAKVWEASNGRELLTLVGHTNDVTSAQFSPDGMRILTTSDDSTIRIWDSRTGDEMLSLPVLYDDIEEWAEFSLDGHLILTESLMAGTRIWSAAPWRPEDWSDETMRTELVRLALRNAPEVHETTLDHAKNEVGPVLEALETLAGALPAMVAKKDVRAVDGQGVYFLKAPSTTLSQLPIKDEDLIVSVNATPVTSIDALAKALTAFVTATLDQPAAPHSLTLDVVNRYDRDQYTITVPAVSHSGS